MGRRNHLSLIIFATGGSLKAEGFGDGGCGKHHPQAAIEAAIRQNPAFLG